MSWYEPSPQQIGIRALDLKDVGGEVQGGDVWPHKQLCIVAHKKKKGFVGARWPWESTRRKSCISPNYARCKKEVYLGEDFECDPTQLVKQSSLGGVQSKFGAGVVVKARVAIHDEVLAQLVILEEASIPIMDEF